jgi:hypothetical protein
MSPVFEVVFSSNISTVVRGSYIPFIIECKYDLTANINIRCNSGSDVKSRINDVDLEADIVVTSQRPLVPMASYGFFRVLRFLHQ